MMARAGRQLLRTRRRRAATRCSREVDPSGSRARGAGRDRAPLVRRRPRRRRRGARRHRAPARPQGSGRRAARPARPAHRDDRGGERARALRRAHPRRPGGVGDRRRRRQAAEGRHPHRVRRGPPRPRRSSPTRSLLDADPRRWACRSSSTPQAATHRSVELERLAHQGVDIANGGWGKGSFLRWTRARNDVAKAGKIIAAEAGRPAREFCPGRRLDAFDQYYSHRQKQKLVVANFTPSGPRTCPRALEPGKVYVLDGRDRDPTAMEVAVVRSRRRSSHVGGPACRAPRGASLNPSRTVSCCVGAAGTRRRGGGRGGARRARARRRVAHRCAAHPGAGRRRRRGHVALTFDDGPDPASTPQFLDALDGLGLARHLLHARRDDPP